MDIPLYEKFQQVIHNPSNIQSLLQKVQQHPQDQPKKLQYVVDRLIKAGMSTDIGIKLNACAILQMLLTTFPKDIDRKQIIKKIQEQSDDTKTLKKNEKTALVLGRLVLLKALSPLTKDQYKDVFKLLKVVQQYPDLSEHLIQTVYELLSKIPDAKGYSYLQKLSTTNFKDDMLKKCIISTISNKPISFTQKQIDQVVQVLINELPKHSIVPSFIMKSIKLNTQGWKQFWKHLVEKYGDQSEYNYKGVWVILDFLENRVSGEVDAELIQSIKVTELWDLWMNQLNVLNKKGKQKASEIQINIGNNKKLANDLINFIHDNQIYLNNLHHKHPLTNIYKLVDVEPYLKKLITKLYTTDDKEDWACQLYSIIHINFDQVSEKTLIKAVHILLKYNQKYPIGEKYVQMIWSILNMKTKNLKSSQLHNFNITLFNSIIENLTKIGLDNQDIPQLSEVLSQSFPLIQQLPEAYINPTKNFVVNALLFSIAWNQQIETCLEFTPWLSDLVTFINRAQGREAKPKKKTKKVSQQKQQEDSNKPIHILIEFFTSFLTKSPSFLRDSIQKCYLDFSQYYNAQDLGKLIAVVFRPDAEYIQEQ